MSIHKTAREIIMITRREGFFLPGPIIALVPLMSTHLCVCALSQSVATKTLKQYTNILIYQRQPFSNNPNLKGERETYSVNQYPFRLKQKDEIDGTALVGN